MNVRCSFLFETLSSLRSVTTLSLFPHLSVCHFSSSLSIVLLLPILKCGWPPGFFHGLLFVRLFLITTIVSSFQLYHSSQMIISSQYVSSKLHTLFINPPTYLKSPRMFSKSIWYSNCPKWNALSSIHHIRYSPYVLFLVAIYIRYLGIIINFLFILFMPTIFPIPKFFWFLLLSIS